MSAQAIAHAPDPLPTPTTPYGQALDAVLRDFFAAYPVAATAIGFHALDGEWGDQTEAGRQERIVMLRRHLDRVKAFDEASVSPDERIDRGLLAESIEQMLFGEEESREDAWDPLSSIYVLGSGLFSLLARDFAPWEERGASFLSRVRGLPAALAGMTASLGTAPDRPVSMVHLETALSQLSGVTEMVDDGLTEARARAEAGEATDLPGALEEAGAAAKAALERFSTALDTEIREKAVGDGRLGAQLYAAKLRYTLATEMD